MTPTPTDTGFAHVERRPGAYADSVALLQVSKDVAAVAGVRAAQVAMATPLNLDVIASMGFDLPETSPNDMVVAVRLDDGSRLDAALAAVDDALAAVTRRARSSGSTEEPPRTLATAITRSATTMALVSVPGANAVIEAVDALDAGQDVMVFSDNVPVEQEVALKQLAAERDLLVMGPDCGTAMVDGIGLGFANSVQAGPVGLVAASGTGCQQLMCLLDHAGVGMTAALGVGGRDLSADVGALATRQAMRRLDADPATELMVVVSKPPADEVAAELRRFAETLSTPVHFALLGAGQPDLTASAEAVLAELDRPVPEWPTWGASTSTVSPGRLRGLFAGGTLCDEAMLMATEQVGPVYSNIPLDPAHALDSTLTADGTVMIDFGDDTMTAGRPHPMIDPTIRLEYLGRTAADPTTSVVLMDVVLGHGADTDPAATTAPAIRKALGSARDAGRELAIIVACVGTAGDPQVLADQAAALADAGAEVYLSNARAAARALSLIGAAA